MEVYNAIKEKYYDYYKEKRTEICNAIRERNYDHYPQLRSWKDEFLQNYTGYFYINDKLALILPEYQMQIRIGNTSLFVCVDFLMEEIVIAGSLLNTHHEPIPDTMLEFTLMYGRLPQIPS